MVYQDDILIFSESFSDHLKHLEIVLDRLRKAGITLLRSKCNFGKSKVKFLGHEVSSNGIEKFSGKVKGISELPPPRNKKDIRSFLGAINISSTN